MLWFLSPRASWRHVDGGRVRSLKEDCWTIHAAEAAEPLRAWGGHVHVNRLSIYVLCVVCCVNIDIRGRRIIKESASAATNEAAAGAAFSPALRQRVELILVNFTVKNAGKHEVTQFST